MFRTGGFISYSTSAEEANQPNIRCPPFNSTLFSPSSKPHCRRAPVSPPARTSIRSDQEGSAYFGELEEALMQGVVGVRSHGERKPPDQSSELEQQLKHVEIMVFDADHQSKSSPDKSSLQSHISHLLHQPFIIRYIKTLRRLAQNREAAKKSRLRKKAYVQQLETSRIKLIQLEQELQRARSQVEGLMQVEISAQLRAIFDMEYGRWLEEQKHMSDLRGGLHARPSDGDLRAIIDKCLTHHDDLFSLRASITHSDVLHLITGTWASPAERCFLWMGGFRPSDLIKVLMAQLDPLTEQQVMGMCSLQQSSEQAEEALSQGLERLQHSLADTVAGRSTSDDDVGGYMGQMTMALGMLSNLENFVQEADNMRQQALHQIRWLLTIRQAAQCFLAIGDYNHRLRALSSLWASWRQDDSLVQAVELLLLGFACVKCYSRMSYKMMVDCGMFVIKFGEYLIKRMPWNFEQSDILRFREYSKKYVKCFMRLSKRISQFRNLIWNLFGYIK
ncbi:TGACG-sequence-specific DNA-binding protein TGA-2.1 [Acorus calamus]|uniref:TGACG-sequence-specific DNA-binding protein TGA-2.1 n=1 Tax=Acorus calamus TaxID=4465 RepID=A0AAV9FDK6_ACOCL|nr:TGACG-sequence-specific DNA-binding protein TGA-2.1 [Acorus calamus]